MSIEEKSSDNNDCWKVLHYLPPPPPLFHLLHRESVKATMECLTRPSFIPPAQYFFHLLFPARSDVGRWIFFSVSLRAWEIECSAVHSRERERERDFVFYLSGGRCVMSCGGGLEDGCGSTSQIAWRRLTDDCSTSHHWLHERRMRLVVRLEQQLAPVVRWWLLQSWGGRGWAHRVLRWMDERWRRLLLLLLLLMMEDAGITGAFGQKERSIDAQSV